MYMIKKRLTYVFKCFNEIIMGNNDIYIYIHTLWKFNGLQTGKLPIARG